MGFSIIFFSWWWNRPSWVFCFFFCEGRYRAEFSLSLSLSLSLSHSLTLSPSLSCSLSFSVNVFVCVCVFVVVCILFAFQLPWASGFISTLSTSRVICPRQGLKRGWLWFRFSAHPVEKAPGLVGVVSVYCDRVYLCLIALSPTSLFNILQYLTSHIVLKCCSSWFLSSPLTGNRFSEIETWRYNSNLIQSCKIQRFF